MAVTTFYLHWESQHSFLGLLFSYVHEVHLWVLLGIQEQTSFSVSVSTGRKEKFETITLFPNSISLRFNGII